MTGFIITLSVMFLTMLGGVFFLDIHHGERLQQFLCFAIGLLFIFLLFGTKVFVDTKQNTIEYLKTEYPILAEAMHETELRKELEEILADKQVNDKRYMEIVGELGNE